MDYNLNYYAILEITPLSTDKEIKKQYYNKSKEMHPDKGGQDLDFSLLSKAYAIMSDKEKREDYDNKSKFGSNYSEDLEFLDFEFGDSSKINDDDKLASFKKENVLNIIVYIDETFNGTLEYQRYIICKKCKGTGKDTTSKIEIKDSKGKVIKTFEGNDGCDFCEGSGKSWNGSECAFCGGEGKVGLTECKTCNGEKRILGKQKLTGIKLDDGKSTKIKAFGHFTIIPGKVGDLVIVKK